MSRQLLNLGTCAGFPTKMTKLAQFRTKVLDRTVYNFGLERLARFCRVISYAGYGQDCVPELLGARVNMP